MNLRGLVSGLSNPDQVTWKILNLIFKAGKLAFFDLAKFNLKKLAGRLFNVAGHDVDQLPKRYRLPAYIFAALGTVYGWMAVLAVFFPKQASLPIFTSLLIAAIFYALALFIIWLYPRRIFTAAWRVFMPRLAEVIRRLRRVVERISDVRGKHKP